MKKGYKENSLIWKSWITNDDAKNVKESRLKKQFAVYLDIFKELFLTLYISKVDLTQYKKTRNKKTLSSIPIKRTTYNIHILIALWLIKNLIPYWNSTNNKDKQIKELSDAELIIVRWVAVGYNFFIERKDFLKICKIIPELENLPEDYNSLMKWTGRGIKNNNLSKYMQSIDKYLIIKSIYFLCKMLDEQKLQWGLAEFLFISIRNLLTTIEITQEELEGKDTGIHIKITGERMISDTLFEKFFFWTKWNKSLAKTWMWYCENFPEKLKNKISFWK
jgi:hypothetical protein